jgi:cytochrome c5
MKLSVNKLKVVSAPVLMVQLLVQPVYADDQYVTSDDQKITQGREIWLNNCESCHGYGIADAPIPMNPEEWEFRLAKGKSVLYEHAINGFIGPDYSMMPARGGNEKLNDDEVKLAVDYMIYLAGFYINKQVEQ